MGFWNSLLARNKALDFSFDLDLLCQTSERAHIKRLALENAASLIARTISQSEFKVKENGKYVKNELYYRLNVRPNLNQTASTFWQKVMYKIIFDNEVLIVQSDTGDLLVADTFVRTKYAIFEDTFSGVVVDDYMYQRTFTQSQVLHLKYANTKLTPLIDSLYKDYGELFGRLMNSQKSKNQIRSTVTIDALTAKNEQAMKGVQDYINKLYKAFETKDIAIVPELNGIQYKEHAGGGGSSSQSFSEIKNVTDSFMDQVATALGIPIALIRNDIADIKGVTENYMLYCINPLLKKITDEANAKFFEKESVLNGDGLFIKAKNYASIFSLSTSIDKLISSGIFTGNEIRAELGYEEVDDDSLNVRYITKNYAPAETLKGGENEND